ncbi:MAG: polyphosphate kinase 1 [Oscillospiraceae bacterium]|nr:polyphosphate kinase 1 [Oscillospiraceae bacterium]
MDKKNLPFISRELSWMKFNERVLAEAARVPGALPLERLKFLAITASNLDEFFMVRVSYLNDRKGTGTVDDAGLTAGEQLEQLLDRITEFKSKQNQYHGEILEDLQKSNIVFLKSLKPEDSGQITANQRQYLKNYFEDEVLPVLTPLAVDISRPFPLLANMTLNIGVRMSDEDGNELYSIIQVPSILPRFIPIRSSGEVQYFLPLEELIIEHIGEICNLYDIEAYGCFRITRSAGFDADEETDDLLEEMKRAVKKRKRGKPICLEVSDGFDAQMRSFLREMLPVSKRFMFESPNFLDLNALMKMSFLSGFEKLRFTPPAPKVPADFFEYDNIFDHIREKDRFIHCPFESFDPVVEFINRAADDPSVLAIKQTLYRVSGKSKIITALERAADAGKQVTVLVELKARFDEENNIQWATQLERAGCHVIYGIQGLKTHCKVTLVVRREEDGIRRYLHLGTGNYNDVTARIYTDTCIFTCRPAFGTDASALFNHLTGFSMPPHYNKLVVAPKHLKQFFIDGIEQEIRNAKNGLPCGINFKTNSLLETDVIVKLYEASQAGVPVKLLVRGICGLVPGVKNVSENIRVRSVVGTFLEHSRIYVFENAGEPLLYMGSADLMPRNLLSRVEVVFPVEDPQIKTRAVDILDLMWLDNTNAWEMDSSGEYSRVKKAAKDKKVNSQLTLLKG